jgi:hypothetical protein
MHLSRNLRDHVYGESEEEGLALILKKQMENIGDLEEFERVRLESLDGDLRKHQSAMSVAQSLETLLAATWMYAGGRFYRESDSKDKRN